MLGDHMPRTEKKVRGVFERPPKSGVWWVQYFADGKRRREKVGRKSDAIALYQQRKAEARAGVKLPTLRGPKGLRIGELIDDVLKFVSARRREAWNSNSVGRRKSQNQPCQTSRLVPDRCRNFCHRDTGADRRPGRLRRGSFYCARQRRYRSVPGGFHLARRKSHPHHQRPESEQR